MSDTTKKDLSRRVFLANAGKGLAAAQAIGALATRASAQQVPEPPGRKLGWAIVGLGSLAINQILPAFARAEKSRVVALVSGHPDKARKLALRYGVAPKSLYDYQGYDALRDNPEVDVVYVVLPNSMHAEYTIRAHQAGKHVLCEKPMATTAGRLPGDDRRRAQGRPQADGRLPLPLRALQPGDDPDGSRAGARAGQGRSWRTTASASATRPSGGSSRAWPAAAR